MLGVDVAEEAPDAPEEEAADATYCNFVPIRVARNLGKTHPDFCEFGVCGNFVSADPESGDLHSESVENGIDVGQGQLNMDQKKLHPEGLRLRASCRRPERDFEPFYRSSWRKPRLCVT